MFRSKRIALVLCLLAALGAAVGHAMLSSLQAVPATRLAPDAAYPDMPADVRHRYLTVPLDHAAPARGVYRAYYLLGKGFDPAGPVVFFLTDGQMELVSPDADASFFDAQLPGLSYVLVGHRGHGPAQFPEVYRGGRTDVAAAMNLYGSWQQVEDIERVRQDMAAHGLLPPDGRIMLFGASGAGMLVQQYLHRHGGHVSRALLATTGAPDLARLGGRSFARRLDEFDPRTAAALARRGAAGGVAPDLAYMLFQLGRQGAAGLARYADIVPDTGSAAPLAYAWHWLHPSLNWPLARSLMDAPAADAVKVRMVELMGADLKARAGGSAGGSAGSSSGGNAGGSAGEPLPYAWSAQVLADFMAADAPLPDLRLDRARFRGEVLVVAGAQDVVFSPAIGAAIATAYPDGRFLLVRGGHRLERDPAYQHALRRAFFRHGLHAPQTRALLAAPPA
ncbi:hypothetical protein [uncultured Massilia sp.]|uniref:hypothetical protein n=1 Tax=uncultured Massilia sp. TaxID=169973 RepID=UPI0025D611E1|nr:hypothetical protein [uncultured Massilia sp.]